MPFPNNIARIDWHFTNGVGAHCHVIQHARCEAGDYDAGEVAIVGSFCRNAWDTVAFLGTGIPAMKSQANLNTTLIDVTVTGLAAVTPPQHVEPVNVAGSQAGVALPPETALVVGWYTGMVGKSYRGRSYWPGLDFDQLENNGTLSAAALTAYTNMFNAYVDKMADTTPSALVVYSPTIPTSSLVTTAVVRDTPHHQRRRNS